MNRRSAWTLAALGAAALAVCACGTLTTAHARLEIAEGDGEGAYQGAITALDAALAAGVISQASHDAYAHEAAVDLNAFRAAYDAGQSLGAGYAKLEADLKAAKGVKP